jgi:hypothetical protein
LCSADYVKPNFTKLVVFFNRKIWKFFYIANRLY